MKIRDINKGLDAIHEAIDFISSNSDGDETGIGDETIRCLADFKTLLEEQRYKQRLNTALAKVRKTNRLTPKVKQ